ncbi:nuclear transport factor 2 family protein [Peribacillus sp. SI8-4]|uniref:nuclear transport factor 2 family protein n=1 Tax=Peribacillus sp. SI8-4 TaxID=3048009 RepID=UPI00255477F1|nr:nuclear transport factor 2 family protein [Peribacillus sp. SI8-4]
MKQERSLEERIQYLEDIESIKKLQATYGHYVDKGWNGKEVNFEKLPALFTEDAAWKCAAMGVDSKGIDNIIEMLKAATAEGELGMHSFTNPIINVSGDKATGKYLLWVGVKNHDGTNLVYQSEDVEYLRTAEGWKISAINLHFAQLLNS